MKVTQGLLDKCAENSISVKVDSWPVDGAYAGQTINSKLYLYPSSDVKILSASVQYSDGFGGFGSDSFVDNGSNFVLNRLKAGSNYTFVLETETVQSELVVMTVSDSDLSSFSEKGVSLYINSVLIETPTDVIDGDFLEFKADDNFKIESCSVFYSDNYGGSREISFKISDDEKSASKTIATGNKLSGVGFVLKTFEDVPEVVGLNNIYLMTQEEVRSLNKNRFITIGGADSSEVVDYGKYIINILEMPFAIDPSYFLNIEKIKLGDKEIGTASQKISNDKIELDIAKIKVDEKYSNSLDFESTVCELFLPLTDKINLEPEICVGYEITVKLVVDLYVGTGVYYIYSSKNSDLVSFSSVDFDVKVPLANTTGTELNSLNITQKTSTKKWFNFPFIQVKRNKVKDGQFFNSYYEDYGFLTKGYKVIDEIEIDFCDNNEESEILETILKQGIFIND